MPTRYCTGYLGHMGTPTSGRVSITRGRDAADVAIATTFGPYLLDSFRVWAVEADKLAK